MSQYQGDFTPGMIPQYASGPYGQPPSRTSVTAVLSLVFGILGCIPFVTGLCAFVLGIVGIRATSNPNVTGRGLAIAGLVLGILSILFWSGVGGIVGWGYYQTGPDRARAQTFITDLGTGNTSAAKAMCSTAVSNAQIDAAVAQLQSAGTLKKVFMVGGFNVSSTNGSTQSSVRGTAIFMNGQSRQIEVNFSHTGGSVMIEDFNIR